MITANKICNIFLFDYKNEFIYPKSLGIPKESRTFALPESATLPVEQRTRAELFLYIRLWITQIPLLTVWEEAEKGLPRITRNSPYNPISYIIPIDIIRFCKRGGDSTSISGITCHSR